MNSEQRPYSAPESQAQVSTDLVHDLAVWAERSAPAPMPKAALVFALATVGGIASRAFNIEGTGLNQYFVLVAPSGTGKGIIAKCFSKVISEVALQAPCITDFKGMGHIASGQAIIKWLDDAAHPVAICMLDEMGHDLEEMGSPRNIVGKIKEKVLLQMWPLSGSGNVFYPMAHSDKEKNTNPLYSPALTIAGTTTPDQFNLSLSENLAASGLLARLLILESTDEIPPYNEGHQAAYEALPLAIVNSVANLAARASDLAQRRQVQPVEMTAEAKAHFRLYREAQRQRANATAEGPARQLWNRSHEKALRLAATIAVGRNHIFPCVGLAEAQWATGFIDAETEFQFRKFANGETGEVEGNEAKQIKEVIRVIKEYTHNDFDTVAAKYGGHFDMHKQGVIPEAFLLRRLMTLKAFKPYPTRSIKQAIKSLLEADDLREMPPTQMLEKYGSKPKAYVISNPHRFK